MYSHVRGVYYPTPDDCKDTFLCKTWSDVEKYVLQPRSMVCYGTGLENGECCETTLDYMFNHMRCGVYVLIMGGKLAVFAPFANASYTNNFDITPLEVGRYSAEKAAALKKPAEALLPLNKWWANAGGILCNVMPQDVWGDYMLPEHKQFLLNICAQVKNCEFILNKRDHPQLRIDRTEAYAHCFMASTPLPAKYSGKLLPVLSGYTGPLFQDVAWPLPCDMCGAGGGEDVRLKATEAWDTRTSRAVFRGSSTGAIPNNVRIDLCVLSLAHPDDVDAKLTAWNSRDRVVAGQVTYLRPDARLKVSPRMGVAQQQQMFKYVIYVEGHSAASRYLELMVHGFVIIKVDTRHTTADQLWYFDQLKDGVDHVRVSADLSNLIPCIRWLRANDERAKSIAMTARQLGMRLLAAQPDYAVQVLNLLS